VTEDDLLAFIATSIVSVWALELLLLLRRDPGRAWQPDALVRELRSSTSVITDALRRLQDAGLVMRDDDGSARYHSASPQLDRLASELEKIYAAKPMAVINAIVNARTDKLRAFSDAFKLKD
jgi:DNA-binding GntR family transcriptional regulator